MLGSSRLGWRWLTEGFARPFVLLKIPPNALTLFSLVPALAAGWFIWQHHWLLGLLCGAVAACLDFVDGAVARMSGKVTAFGGYLDSVLDRYVDGIILFGIGLALDRVEVWATVGACLLGAFGTSYARARLYQERSVPPGTWNDLLERPDRLILLGLGLLGQGLTERLGQAYDVLFWVLIVFAIGSNLTVIQRILKSRRLLGRTGA